MVRLIRRLLPYTSIALGIAVLYAAWTIVSRRIENRRLEQAAEARRIEAYKRDVRMYGSGKVKILSFYATPAPLVRGSRAQLCYGVANAETVRIEPPVERVWPSLSRCLEIAPNKDTQYTLTAKDAQGHTATQSLLLQVR